MTSGFDLGYVEQSVTLGRWTPSDGNKKGALDHGRWFSPGTPSSSTTKTSRHDIAEILLKVALNTKNQSINLKPSKICDLKEINNFLKDHLMIINV
jgi:hypothetical protein